MQAGEGVYVCTHISMFMFSSFHCMCVCVLCAGKRAKGERSDSNNGEGAAKRE